MLFPKRKKASRAAASAMIVLFYSPHTKRTPEPGVGRSVLTGVECGGLGILAALDADVGTATVTDKVRRIPTRPRLACASGLQQRSSRGVGHVRPTLDRRRRSMSRTLWCHDCRALFPIELGRCPTCIAPTECPDCKLRWGHGGQSCKEFWDEEARREAERRLRARTAAVTEIKAALFARRTAESAACPAVRL